MTEESTLSRDAAPHPLVLVVDDDRNFCEAIARSLVITKRAVERHINSIFAKLGLADEVEVHRRVSAVLLYLADR